MGEEDEVIGPFVRGFGLILCGQLRRFPIILVIGWPSRESAQTANHVRAQKLLRIGVELVRLVQVRSFLGRVEADRRLAG